MRRLRWFRLDSELLLTDSFMKAGLTNDLKLLWFVLKYYVGMLIGLSTNLTEYNNVCISPPDWRFKKQNGQTRLMHNTYAPNAAFIAALILFFQRIGALFLAVCPSLTRIPFLFSILFFNVSVCAQSSRLLQPTRVLVVFCRLCRNFATVILRVRINVVFV